MAITSITALQLLWVLGSRGILTEHVVAHSITFPSFSRAFVMTGGSQATCARCSLPLLEKESCMPYGNRFMCSTKWCNVLL